MQLSVDSNERCGARLIIGNYRAALWVGPTWLEGRPTLPPCKSPQPKKPQHISSVSHSTLNDVLLCSAHTAHSDQATDWTTEGLWFTSRQQTESLLFEVSPVQIRGCSGRDVRLNTRILQLPMLRISGKRLCVNSPNTEGVISPLSTKTRRHIQSPKHGDTSSPQKALRSLARDDKQATKKWGTNNARYHHQNTLTFPSPVVTVFTTRFNIHNSTFCPHTIFMYFVWISEQTAIISLYSINWLVFIAETECVYCAVRSELLSVTLTLRKAVTLNSKANTNTPTNQPIPHHSYNFLPYVTITDTKPNPFACQ